jgi:ELMO domain-containing protein
VQNLLYLAHTYPGEFDRLLHKRSGTRVQWEYPFAAAGINLTFALAELLGFKHAKPLPPGTPW